MTGISGQLHPQSTLKQVLDELRAYAESGKHSAVVGRNLRWMSHHCGRYRDDFQFAASRLKKTAKLSDSDADTLVLLYGSTLFGGQEELRLVGSLKACPLCGIRHGLTLDHYLPKSRKHFPHFSYFSFNLVPSCSACQGTKGVFHPSKLVRHPMYVKKNGPLKRSAINSLQRRHGVKFRILNDQRLIHPYFDVDIDPSKIAMRFSVDPIAGPESPRLVYLDRGMTPAARLFRNHIRLLKVEARIQIVIRHYWDSLGRSFRAIGLSATKSSVTQELWKLSHHHEELDGVGSVSAMFYRALSESSLCVEMLVNNLTLPSPILSTTR